VNGVGDASATRDRTYVGLVTGLERPRDTLRPIADEGADATPGGSPLPSLEGYDVAGVVGRGGMGVVYEAAQRSLGRPVALKTLLAGRPDAAQVARFEREARIAARLDHPAIPPIVDLVRDGPGRPFLAMKLVRGVPWSELLAPSTEEGRARAAGMDLRAHLAVLARVAEAVAHAHGRGIVHRDVKPENVMVGDLGLVLLVDWGVALDLTAADARPAPASGERVRMRARPVGTPAYMAPEMADGRDEEIGPRSDVYLLGATLYEVLTGAPPHAGEDVLDVLLAAHEGLVAPPAARAPGRRIPSALAELAMRALDRDPARRPASAEELIRGLEAFARTEASTSLADAALAEASRVAAAPGLPSSEVYAAMAGAVHALERAVELWPGNAAARAGLSRTRARFALVAILGRDLGLAAAVLDRAPEASAVATEAGSEGAAASAEIAAARARLEEARAQARARGARRRVAVALLALTAAAGLGLALVNARRAWDSEAARGRREQAMAAVVRASWGDEAAQVAAHARAALLDPTWAEAWAQLGRARIREVDRSAPGAARRPLYEAAAEALDRAIALEPSSALALNDRAYVAAMLGEGERASALYARCAAADPDGHAGLEAAGIAALREGRADEAVALFGRAIRAGAEPMDHFERAVARYARGDLDGALEDSERVRALAPEHEWYAALEALVRLGKDDARGAGRALARGLSAAPRDPGLMALAAVRAARMGDLGRVTPLLAMAREERAARASIESGVDPYWRAAAGAPAPLAAAGRALVDLTIDATAFADAKEAPSLAARRRAEERLGAGDLEGAIAAATEAIGEDPADGVALLVRGVARARLDRRAAAREDLEAASRLAPERAAEVTEALRALERR